MGWGYGWKILVSWEFTGNLILWVITESQYIDGDLPKKVGLEKKSWVLLVFLRKDGGRVDTPMHTMCQFDSFSTMKLVI